MYQGPPQQPYGRRFVLAALVCVGCNLNLPDSHPQPAAPTPYVREVPRVLKEGLAKKKLRSKGQKRATTYLAA